MKTKNRPSDATLMRKFASELRRLRHEEARLASCLQRFESTPAWTLTFAEAANVLGCTEKEVRRLTREQTSWGRVLRALIRSRRIPRSELRRYLEERGQKLRQEFIWGIERIVLPDFNPLHWHMDHDDLSTTQAAQRLGISSRQVVELIKDGPLHAAKSWGGRFQISPHEVEEFKKAHGELIASANRAA